MGDWEVTVHGVNEVEAALKLAGDRAVPYLQQAMMAELQLVMIDSKQIVPVGKTGNLKASGTILPPQLTYTGVKIVLGYGGAASAYAPYVHNLPRIMHPTKPGTKSHFLSDPLKAHLPKMESRIAERIARLAQ